jgi:hypothetical protein
LTTDSNKQEKEEADRIVFDYLKTDPSQRGTGLPVYKIKQGLEPPIFSGFFAAWDAGSRNESDYSSIKAELQAKNQPALFQQAVKDKSLANGAANFRHLLVDFNQCPKYNYEDLLKPVDELPENVISELKEV